MSVRSRTKCLWVRVPLFYYIDQPRTPSFPIGLVKTESAFIDRSVETGSGRWTLVVAVITVDTCPFLAFSDLTCHLEDTRISVFWLHCAELWSSVQEASPSGGRNTWIVLCHVAHGSMFLGYFLWCRYFWGPWVSFVTTDEFLVRITKITSRIAVSWTHSLPFYF